VLDWIEKHPSSIALILAVAAGACTIYSRIAQKRIKLKLTLTIPGFSINNNQTEGLRISLLRVRIQVNNLSSVPVGVAKFYLELDRSLLKDPSLKTVLMSIDLKKGVRIYQNNLQMTVEEGSRVLVPFDLPMLAYYNIELRDNVVNNLLVDKYLRFVLFDQRGKEHKSRWFRVRPHQMIGRMYDQS